jgi:hypothetical protein
MVVEQFCEGEGPITGSQATVPPAAFAREAQDFLARQLEQFRVFDGSSS